MSEGESAITTMADASPADTTPEPAADAITDIAPETPVETPEAVEPDLERVESEPQEPAKPAPNFGTEAARTLRELSDTNPDKAPVLRQIKGSVFREGQYKQSFESPELAQRVRATFDAAGGDKGIAELQDAQATMRHIDEIVHAGSPEFVDGWMKEAPEGFLNAMPYALQKLQQMNQDTYYRIMTPHLIRTLWATNINDVIKNLEGYALRFGDNNFTADVNGMRNWLNEMVQTYRLHEQQQNDPRAAEYKEREAQLAQKEQNQFMQDVIRATDTDVWRSIEDAFKQHDRRGIFKGDQRTKMLEEVAGKIDQTLGGDEGYQKMLATLKYKRDLDGLVRYIKSKVDSVRGAAAREVWELRAAPFLRQARQPEPNRAIPAANGTPPTATAGRAGNNKVPLPIPQKPNGNDIDWDRDPNRYEFINGRGYLKNGKYVTWRKAS